MTEGIRRRALVYLRTLCISSLIFIFIVISLPFFSNGLISTDSEARIVVDLLILFVIYQVFLKNMTHNIIYRKLVKGKFRGLFTKCHTVWKNLLGKVHKSIHKPIHGN